LPAQPFWIRLPSPVRINQRPGDLPGLRHLGADKLRGDADAVRLIRSFFQSGKPAGVICHGPWTLVEAGVVRGRTLTSWPTLATDIRNAGGTWVDQEVVTDQRLVTSRGPDDLPAFCAKIVEEFAEGKHPAQARST
jgi:protease I